jgi:hypothetical protein
VPQKESNKTWLRAAKLWGCLPEREFPAIEQSEQFLFNLCGTSIKINYQQNGSFCRE